MKYKRNNRTLQKEKQEVTIRKIGSYNKKTIKLQKQRRKEKYENIKRRKLQDPN